MVSFRKGNGYQNPLNNWYRNGGKEELKKELLPSKSHCNFKWIYEAQIDDRLRREQDKEEL